MKLSVLAVGKLKSGPDRELFERYASRIKKSGRSVGVTDLVLTEIAESRISHRNGAQREESQKLAACVAETDCLIVLDETGKDLNSQQFSTLIRNFQQESGKVMHFAVGGAEGHSDELLSRASHVIRFGRLTWPHQLVRIMLAEQLYRAVTILSGHPYHRDG